MLWSIRFSSAAIILGATLLAATYALDRESGPFGAGASILFFIGFVLFNTSLMVYRCQASRENEC